jgi:hypothetical protein
MRREPLRCRLHFQQQDKHVRTSACRVLHAMRHAQQLQRVGQRTCSMRPRPLLSRHRRLYRHHVHSVRCRWLLPAARHGRCCAVQSGQLLQIKRCAVRAVQSRHVCCGRHVAVVRQLSSWLLLSYRRVAALHLSHQSVFPRVWRRRVQPVPRTGRAAHGPERVREPR